MFDVQDWDAWHPVVDGNDASRRADVEEVSIESRRRHSTNAFVNLHAVVRQSEEISRRGAAFTTNVPESHAGFVGVNHESRVRSE